MTKIIQFLIKNSTHVLAAFFLCWAVWGILNWQDLLLVQKLILGLFALLVGHEYEEGYKERFFGLMGSAVGIDQTSRKPEGILHVSPDVYTAMSHQRFDQCGIVMYLDSENWLKGSVEFENEKFQHLGSVATNNGYSDWATTAISADIKTMWYRLSRREDDFCIECSTDGINFSQMRVCHMYAATDEISFGIYACSPEESSFTAIFTDMSITECAWKAHDGQQPDE